MLSDKAIAALHDIVSHVDMAFGFAENMTERTFSADAKTLYAVIRCLEIISEASRRLPEELKDRHHSVAWKDMAAAGNFYRHEYAGVAGKRIWRTVQVALPPIRAAAGLELADAARLNAGSAASR